MMSRENQWRRSCYKDLTLRMNIPQQIYKFLLDYTDLICKDADMYYDMIFMVMNLRIITIT